MASWSLACRKVQRGFREKPQRRLREEDGELELGLARVAVAGSEDRVERARPLVVLLLAKLAKAELHRLGELSELLASQLLERRAVHAKRQAL